MTAPMRPDPTRVVREDEPPECSCGGVHMGPDGPVAFAFAGVLLMVALVVLLVWLAGR